MATFDVRVASTGRMPLPGPEVYWMSAWDDWFDARFWMVVARDGVNTVLVNTGAPDDLTALNTLWRAGHPSGKSQFSRRADEGFAPALDAAGVSPEEVTHVVLTPVVAYTLGSLHRLPNARIVMSRRGWIEDILVPPIPRHVPREIFMPDDLLTWLLTAGHDRLELIDGEVELLPGLRLWESGVHHRSSMVAEFDTASGVVSVTDSAFAYGNVERNINLGIGESYAEAMATYARIRRTGGALIPLYDPEVAERFPGGEVRW